jgi:hypothetical protein
LLNILSPFLYKGSCGEGYALSFVLEKKGFAYMKLFDKRQEVKFIRMLLNNPYSYLGAHADPKRVGEKFGIYLNADFDYEEAISKLQNAMKSRGKGLERDLVKRIQEAKNKWANDLLDDIGVNISTMGALNSISKKVWGSRISDCYVEGLKERIQSNQKDLFESVVADHSEGDFVDDLLEESCTPEEAPTQTCVSIGDFRIVVPKGSEVIISKVELGDFRVEGGGSVKIGRVTKSNFEDIVIQG